MQTTFSFALKTGVLALTVFSGVASGVLATQVEYVISGTTIEQFDANGNFLLQFGGAGTGNGQFLLPSGIAVDPVTSFVWVSDAILNRVQAFDSNGHYLSTFGSTGTAPGKLYQPYGLSADGSGNVWVAEPGNNRVQEFTTAGVFVQSLNGVNGGGQFNGPVGVAAGGGYLWVSDTGNYRLQVFSLASSQAPPVFVTTIGAYGNGYNSSGIDEFRGPFSIYLRPQSASTYFGFPYGQEVVVADPYNQRYIKAGFFLNCCGPNYVQTAAYGNLAPFSYPSPYGAAPDQNGNVWAVDYNANKVFIIDRYGDVTSFGAIGGGPGQFYYPTYIAIGFHTPAS